MAIVKINLAPYEEIENPYWWVPDALLFVVVVGVAMASLEFHFDQIRSQIDQHRVKTEDLRAEYDGVKKNLERFEEAKKKAEEFRQMYNSLRGITESKISRFLPVILVEHIQNLKPAGIWLTSLTLGRSEGGQGEGFQGDQNEEPLSRAVEKKLVIKGRAFDNVLLAEFLTLLKATKNQETDPADLRTQVFFDMINVSFSNMIKLQVANNNGASIPIVEFEIVASYDEREVTPAINSKISKILKDFRTKHRSRL